MKTYLISRRFTSGTLAGLTHTSKTTVFMPVGFTCPASRYTDAYIITACAEVM